MLYLLFYLVFLPIFAVVLIGAAIFLKNTLKDLEGEEIFDTNMVQSRQSSNNSADQTKEMVEQADVPASCTETAVEQPVIAAAEEKVNAISSSAVQESEVPENGHRPHVPNWSKIIEKISTMRVEEAEQFAFTYFMQYGAGQISFPQECISCGSKTKPQVVKWKAIHKIPALRGAKTPVKKDVDDLWTIVGKCEVCEEKYILANQNADGIVGDLEWVCLQHDNYDRLREFNGRKIPREKLSFVFRTLPDRSLVASGMTGEWIWLKSRYRSYV